MKDGQILVMEWTVTVVYEDDDVVVVHFTAY